MKKKVGIMTINSLNFGNRLQNYALQTIVDRCGCEAYTIRREYSNQPKSIRKQLSYFFRRIIGTRAGLFIRFNNSFINFGEKYATSDGIQKGIEDEYDVYVAGSDQIWNPFFKGLTGTSDLLMFDTKGKKVAYAASFGVDNLPDEKKEVYAKALLDFNSISVREEAGLHIIKELIGIEAELVLDPTLLLDTNEWQEIMKRPRIVPQKDYVVVYFLGDNSKQDKLRETIQIIESEQELVCYDILKKNKRGCKPAVGPSEFLWLIKNAKMVLTDSFHATVFSIIFHIPVQTYKRSGIDMNSRIVNLAEMLGLNKCFNENGTLVLNDNSLYEIIDEKLFWAKRKSIDFLQESLK